jgi:sulfoxide reductase heme-binding subunit YedZ
MMLVLIVTSLARAHIGRRTWRGLHWLAYACWPVALAHSVGSSGDLRAGPLLALTAACTLAVAGALTWRIVRARRATPRARRVAVVLSAQAGAR